MSAMPPPKVFGITGWKNCGKTTLVVALVDEFVRRGLRVSTVKHAHHAFDIDVPGKDSFRHRAAGATEVAVASGARWALMRELRGEPEPALGEILARMSPCDLILVEGFKRDTHPKIEVVRRPCPDAPIADSDMSVLAIATDDPARFPNRRTLRLDDVPGIADFILDICGSRHANP
jgi:molybdopterin-guanine dinucleotide biosynthesis adapter protein